MNHQSTDKSPTLTESARRNIESISKLEQELRKQFRARDWISDALLRWMGSIPFILAHVVLFVGWILSNLTHLFPFLPPDPVPFPLLNVAVALEAVFVSLFVLMNQNRQKSQADHWLHVNLQVALLAEQETTKILEMLQIVSKHLGLKHTEHDQELIEMAQKTQVGILAQELRKARDEDEAPPAAPE